MNIGSRERGITISKNKDLITLDHLGFEIGWRISCVKELNGLIDVINDDVIKQTYKDHMTQLINELAELGDEFMKKRI